VRDFNRFHFIAQVLVPNCQHCHFKMLLVLCIVCCVLCDCVAACVRAMVLVVVVLRLVEVRRWRPPRFSTSAPSSCLMCMQPNITRLWVWLPRSRVRCASWHGVVLLRRTYGTACVWMKGGSHDQERASSAELRINRPSPNSPRPNLRVFDHSNPTDRKRPDFTATVIIRSDDPCSNAHRNR